jgi:hypothetical protein
MKTSSFVIFILLLFPVPEFCRAENWTAYSCSNDKFYSLNLQTGEVTFIQNTPAYWDLTYSSNGTLYGISRKTDAIYRFSNPSTGEVVFLANLPMNSTGSGVTISPDNQEIYFTLSEDQLFKYTISSNTFSNLGTISGAYGLSDIEFSPEGTLYGVTGIGYGTKQLLTIDLETLQAKIIGPELFGIDNPNISTAGSLEFAPDGKLYLTISVDGDAQNYYTYFEYICTLEVSTGIATMNENVFIHDDESQYHSDTLAIQPLSSNESDNDHGCFIHSIL